VARAVDSGFSSKPSGVDKIVSRANYYLDNPGDIAGDAAGAYGDLLEAGVQKPFEYVAEGLTENFVKPVVDEVVNIGAQGEAFATAVGDGDVGGAVDAYASTAGSVWTLAATAAVAPSFHFVRCVSSLRIRLLGQNGVRFYASS
jgi:hypothetical protein